MGGGLLQLVAYGAQDVYLTGNPQITFFKVVYRRHTNFAMEAIEQTPSGGLKLGSRISVQITRNGDLIHRVYFNGSLKNTADGTTVTKSIPLVPNFGQKLLKTIELEIGGQRIDKHYSEWLYVWNELTIPSGKRDGYNLMVGADKLNRSIKLSANKSYELYVPLEFWFCRNVGLALPLIALQYHEVKINIEFESAAALIDRNAGNFTSDEDDNSNGSGVDNTNAAMYGSSADNALLELSDPKIWVDYIFLDTDERRRFAQLSHEYLIEQLQFTGTESVKKSTDPSSMKSVRLNFNHPCKELIWVIRRDDSKVYWNNFSTAGVAGDSTVTNNHFDSVNPVQRAKIMLNGNDRFAERNGTYFSLVQPYQHHENTPNKFHEGINVYSFALKPEEHQPSGTLNMSRIDTAVLSLSSYNDGVLHVYAVNYNVLRILSGMGGLAYSN
jgi:hypothetical protein